MRGNVIHCAPILDDKDVIVRAGPSLCKWRERICDYHNSIRILELPLLQEAVIGPDQGAWEAQLFPQQLRYGDAIEILDPENECRSVFLAGPDDARLRLSRR